MKRTIRVTQIKVPLEHTVQTVLEKVCKILHLSKEDVTDFTIIKQSIDARKRDAIRYVYSAEVVLREGIRFRSRDSRVSEVTAIPYAPVVSGTETYRDPIAVIGTGPAGLFCAYLLAKNGYAPVILERGREVNERKQDIDLFWNTGKLNTESNVQFGEGGAGTFSDGKLNTLVRDKYGRNRFVLETFVRFGAPSDILYVNKPHIGTDILIHVIENMRKEIIRLGGTFHFSSAVTDIVIEDGRLTALQVNHHTYLNVSGAVFAIGHSARDTFHMLHNHSVPMVPKSFAVGLRVEHRQDDIDRVQYSDHPQRSQLPAASYKLTCQTSNGRNVYTFCMCPGGYVVNASSEEGMTAVNGMSYRARDGKNANSAVIISVTPDDFPDHKDPMSGIAFQQNLEAEAFRLGGGAIPQQLFGDFEADRPSRDYGSINTCAKGNTTLTNLRGLFPDELNDAFLEAMHAFSDRIAAFDQADVVLSAVESRTSSPVRMLRDDTTLQSAISGLYPCGEGAGYAGGITSAAMDGLKTAEALMQRFCPRMERIKQE